MQLTAILADWAEAINGKLYLQGGGWNVLVAGQPANIAVAVLVSVPWDRTNEQHRLVVALLDHDGSPVLAGGGPVRMEGGFEIGRPAGVKPGTTLNAPFAFRFQGLVLEPGGYDFRISVNADSEFALPFVAIAQ